MDYDFALAGVTTKIKLGTLLTGVIYRHPSILAKMGATLDMISKGRLFMGIGAGWNEEESLAYGIASSFPSNRERLDRLEEAIQIIRKMWTEEPTATSLVNIIKSEIHTAILSQFNDHLHHIGWWIGREKNT